MADATSRADKPYLRPSFLPTIFPTTSRVDLQALMNFQQLSQLLRLFVRHPGRVLTHRYILREIWGPKSEEHRQYLRVYVTHLRQKIEPDPTKPSLIKTQSGIGYRFAA